MITPKDYQLDSPLLGTIQFRALLPEQDCQWLHHWIGQDYAHFWGMKGHSQTQVENFYSKLQRSAHEAAVVGIIDEQPAFLVELYDPAEHEMAKRVTVQPGDLGMHLLLSPPVRPQSGFSQQVIHSVARYLFECHQARRILVEPDINNHKIHKLNLSVGFTHTQTLNLNHKQALLGILEVDAFHSLNENLHRLNSSTQLKHRDAVLHAANHVKPSHWYTANRHLVVKMLTEFAHERLLCPESYQSGQYLLQTADEQVKYQFNAHALPLDHLDIAAESVVKQYKGQPESLDAMAFIIEFASELGLEGELLATYMEEISSTLTATCYKLDKPSYSSHQLANMEFQVIETEMTEGHPCFVANNGRIGFNTQDYHNYAPEAANCLHLVWLAAHKDNTAFHAIDGMEYQQLMEAELDLSERLALEQQLHRQQLNPDEYYLFPMHPWQWENKIVHLYAREIANKKLVCLGRGHDQYLPQQSVRTLYNLSNSKRYYVKTALSILNMGFMRGLSAGYMAVTPAINQWLFQLVDQDSCLRELNFVPLQELATLGFSDSHYEAPAMGNTQYNKMLAALWRENPNNQLHQGESLATMASLLHVDNQGQSYLGAKIQLSRYSAPQWMQAYLKAYLIPLVHCFYRYKLVYMPHGENLILRFNQHLPAGVFIKDIGEEICLLNDDTTLDEGIRRIQITMPEEMELLSIFTDIFDCIFRFMVPILQRESLMKAKEFWALVALEIKQYQTSQPELAARFEQYDIFCDEFGLSCLNRLQLGNNKQMVDLTDPANSLKFAGVLVNPIAEFKQHSTGSLEAIAGLVDNNPMAVGE